MSALAESAAAAAVALLRAEGAAFVVRHGDSCEYVEVNAVAPAWWKSQRFRLTECVCGWAILNARPALVFDIFSDARVPGKCYMGTGIRSLLAVPVGGPEPLGAMPVYWTQPHDPTEHEVAMAMSLADAAATMVDNLRLMSSLETARAEAEQRSQEIERLNLDLRRVVRELDHRVKNNLAVVLSVSEETFRSSGGGPEFQKAFRGRMMALARVHEALAESGWRGTPLQSLILSVVSAMMPTGRLRLNGPNLVLPARAIFSTAATLHELATNALKYGAWSTGRGVVQVEWSVGADDVLSLRWIERGGPPVREGVQDGFGFRLIRELMPHELEATVEVTFAPAGLEYRASFCLETVELHDIGVPLDSGAGGVARVDPSDQAGCAASAEP